MLLNRSFLRCYNFRIDRLYTDIKCKTIYNEGGAHMQESGEMYLETIYVLSKKSAYVRSIDVGEYMGFSKPSVSRAIGLLKHGEYVKVSPEGHLTLTDAGLEIASKIYERHTLLTKCLTSLGVDEKTAAEDACKIEHDISDASFDAIKRHVGKLKSDNK